MPHYMLDAGMRIYSMNNQPGQVTLRFAEYSVGVVAMAAITFAECSVGVVAMVAIAFAELEVRPLLLV